MILFGICYSHYQTKITLKGLFDCIVEFYTYNDHPRFLRRLFLSLFPTFMIKLKYIKHFSCTSPSLNCSRFYLSRSSFYELNSTIWKMLGRYWEILRQ